MGPFYDALTQRGVGPGPSLQAVLRRSLCILGPLVCSRPLRVCRLAALGVSVGSRCSGTRRSSCLACRLLRHRWPRFPLKSRAQQYFDLCWLPMLVPSLPVGFLPLLPGDSYELDLNMILFVFEFLSQCVVSWGF